MLTVFLTEPNFLDHNSWYSNLGEPLVYVSYNKQDDLFMKHFSRYSKIKDIIVNHFWPACRMHQLLLRERERGRDEKFTKETKEETTTRGMDFCKHSLYSIERKKGKGGWHLTTQWSIPPTSLNNCFQYIKSAPTRIKNKMNKEGKLLSVSPKLFIT